MSLSMFNPVGSTARFFCLLTTVIFQSALMSALAGPARTDPAGDFVQVTAEIELLEWGAGLGREDGPAPKTFQVSAVVGRNTWVITNSTYVAVYCYDGKRITARRQVQVHSTPDPATLVPSKEWRVVDTIESSDGNSGQEIPLSNGRVGVRDPLETIDRIVWLGFCSAPTLNNPQHKVYPPWNFWVEYLDPKKLSDKVTRFEDDLGLPKNVFIWSNDKQIVVDSRAGATTTVAGWTFPLGFYLIEYNPAIGKSWTLQLLAHGKVSSIATVSDPFAKGTRRFTATIPSKLHIEGTSNVHDWSLESTNVVGFLDLNESVLDGGSSSQTLSNGVSDESRASGEFLFPVRYLSSRNSAPMFSDKADRAVLHQALKTTECPNLVYRLYRLSPLKAAPKEPSTSLMESTGDLVIAGARMQFQFQSASSGRLTLSCFQGQHRFVSQISALNHLPSRATAG